MNAAETMTGLIHQLNKFLESDEIDKSSVPVKEWEARYKRLKAIKDFFGLAWNDIEREIKSTECKEEWIWESRKDLPFKKYYGLRLKMDKMEVLLK